MKQYELTNHLGNVMAVVSDKRVHLDDNGDTLIDRYSPSLAAVYDYFPFGMLMPGRYLQDDATHCMTITQTQIVPVRVPVIDHVTGPFSPVKGGSGIFVPLDEDVVITASSVGSGVEISHSVTAGAALALELEVKTVEYGSFSVVISEEVAGKQVVLGGMGIQARGAYSASIVPQSSTVKVSITTSSAQAQGARLIIKPYVWTWTVPTPKAVPVVVCNDREDYRFGFNGQEKVNEIAGIGNHTTALFWEYDTRIGRRWNLDPKPNIGISEYSVFAGNPILYNDVNGDIIIFDKTATTQFKKAAYKAAFQLIKHGQVAELRQLMASKHVYVLKEFDGLNGNFTPNKDAKGNWTGGGTINWNPRLALRTNNNVIMSPTTIGSHELDHAAQMDRSPYKFRQGLLKKNGSYSNNEEKRVITGSEQRVSRALGETKKGQVTRTDHSAKSAIITDDPTSTKGTEVPLSVFQMQEVIVKPQPAKTGK